MRIDSSGRVGIGTTNPRAKLSVTNGSENTSGDAPQEAIITGANQTITSGNGILAVQSNTAIGADVGATIALGGRIRSTGTTTDASNFAVLKGAKENATSDNSAGYFAIATKPNALAPVERMRIASGGQVIVGGTSSLFPVNFNVFESSTLASEDGYNGNPPVRIHMRTDITGGLFVEFTKSDGARIGSITRASGTTVAYNTSSDYRLKENVTYDFDATTRLKQLKPARFNFITEPNKTVDGFLAHEVSDIIPEAITGHKDEIRDFGNIVDENNNIIHENVNENYPKKDGQTWTQTGTRPVYQGIDQAKLTPILTKALQEAIAKIEQLEARLTALES